MRFAVFGLDYLSLFYAVLLTKHHVVVAGDNLNGRVQQLIARKSPIVDAEVELFFATRAVNRVARRKTSTVEAVISVAVAASPKVTVIDKSTIPVGFIENMQKHLYAPQVIFSRQFLREGQALCDNLHHSRKRVSGCLELALILAKLVALGRGEEGC